MKKYNTLLIVDDNRTVLTALSLLLRPMFEKTVTLQSPVRVDEILRNEKVDCVLLDMNFSSGLNNGNEGLFTLRQIRKASPETVVILITAYADINIAVTGIKDGATDFIVKPWDNATLVTKVREACSRKAGSGGQPKGSAVMYWGTSEKMNSLRDIVIKVAPTDANILITGENGTGKELLAEEIHSLSRRRTHPMQHVDIGSMTESLFESELFGHVKGAFTNAVSDRTGKIEAAAGSTLFLDEIGNMPLHLQAKLLTALQRREVVRVGSNRPIKTDIRLICATNSDPDAMVAAGSFREDLLYRINTIHLHLPPLRERGNDIVRLATRFIEEFARIYSRDVTGIDRDTERLLLGHPWHGNIRELRHAIEKAVILSEGPVLTSDLFTLSRHSVTESTSPSTLEAMERVMILRAINDCGGNLSAASAQLGITRQTLYNKMKRYAL